MTIPRLPTVAFVLSLAACGGSNEAGFGPPKTLPKKQRPTVWDAPAKDRLGLPDMRMPAPAGETKGEIVWVGDTPAGWEALPAQPARFRDALWRVAGNADTECYLTAAVRGGVAGNVSRWYRDQFSIQEVPAAEALQVVELAGRPGRLAEIEGTFQGRDGAKPGWAALIAFVALQGDEIMTFKFTGPGTVVAANRDKFLALAKSLRSATKSPDPKAPPIQPGAQLPPGHAPVDTAPDPHGAPPPASAAPFTATTPAGWTAKVGKPLHHTFGKGGEVYVSQLGGSLKSSLDIWRGEMGVKEPITDAQVQALPRCAFLGEDAVLLDLSGDMNGMVRQLSGARMLLAARGDGGSITFCKLVGTAAEVEGQVEAFRQFCASVRRVK